MKASSIFLILFILSIIPTLIGILINNTILSFFGLTSATIFGGIHLILLVTEEGDIKYFPLEQK